MKKYKSLSVLFVVLVLFGLENCRKSLSDRSSPLTDQVLIETAREYFHQNARSAGSGMTGNPRLDAVRNPDWRSAYCIHLSTGEAVVVPVFYEKNLVVTTNFSGSQIIPLNQLTKLVIYTDSSGYHPEVVTSFPDNTVRKINSGGFSGIVFVETWAGQALRSYRYGGGKIWVKQADVGTGKGIAKTVIPDAAKTPETIIATCYEISGYNYSANDPDNGYYWTEPAGCDYQYIPDGGIGGGLSGGDIGSVAGGGGNTSDPSRIAVASGNNIIGNITDYLKCFSNYGGTDHSYQVTICVSQPVPGTRAAWTTADGPSGTSANDNPVNTGHTYLVFSEIFSGYSIVRNVGFYPQALVTPLTPSSQGQLNNDANHAYNISLTVTVDNGQFFNMLNYVGQGNNTGYMYNLSTNNCTSFSLHTLDAGGVILPSTVGTWPGGGFGNDPGDLGEDIRGMQLTSNMTRSTVYNAHPNLYTCN